MACYAAVASLVNLLDDILHHHHRYKDLGFWRLPTMESLLVKLKSVQGLLRDKCTKPDNDFMIQYVAEDARDLIQYEIHRLLTIDTHLRPTEKISEDFIQHSLRLEEIITSHAQDLMALEEEEEEEQTKEEGVERRILSGMCSSHFPFKEKFEGNFAPSNLERHSSRVSDPSSAHGNTMIGFDEDFIKIKEDLCGHSSQLKVISIVGNPGIGKTTLARNAFKDSVIVRHFDCRGWVTISMEFHRDRVVDNLIKSLHINELDEVAPREVIYKYLEGKRYLIVLDDIWSTGVLDDLKGIFPDDHNGSRILLTSGVLTYETSVDSHHEIQPLNENQSWNLLQAKVFAAEHCLPQLEYIGKQIAKKCRGTPLTTVVIAGILSNVRTQYHWIQIERSMSAVMDLQDGFHGFLNILLLSYNHLPHHLKTCFLYIGLFPYNYEINISRLINMWIAEGFIEQGNTSKSIEEVGEECVQDLVRRNLIVVTKRKSSGKFKCCVMNYLLWYFCSQQALQEEFFKYGLNHSSSSSPWFSRIFNKSLRSIIWFGNYIKDSDHNIFGRYLLLETLDLLNLDTQISWLPQVVFELIHLKLLALGLRVKSLSIPQSISKLLNLQTIIMPRIQHLQFPEEIWEMSLLRHIKTHRMMLPAPAPPQVVANGGLENLQTLSKVKCFIFTADTIRMIANLKRLKISYDCYGSKDEWNSYGLYHLVQFQKLEVLSISFKLKFYISSLPTDFTFPLSLKKLCLSGTWLPWKELGVVAGSLPNLQVLKLRRHSVEGDEWEPVEGEFLHLEFLLMENLTLQHWRVDNTHFPCLRHLSLIYCQDLVEIPSGIGKISTLTSIDIRGNKGVKARALRIHEELESMGNGVQVDITTDDFWF